MQKSILANSKSEFIGQTAVITGAASGIGRALAKVAQARGMYLLLADWDQKGLDQLVSELTKTGSKVLGLQVDVSQERDLQQLAKLVEEEFGEVNLLFNNAGVCPMGNAWELSARDWQWVLDVNVMGVVHGQRAFLPLMMSQTSSARIINMGSIAGLSSNPGGTAYTASKHAVVAISESLFMDLQIAKSAVRVSVVCPGFVNTNLAAERGRSETEEVSEGVELGRRALQNTLSAASDPEEIAETVFAGIENNKFWIFTHPEMLGGFDMRCNSIRQGSDPSFVPIFE